MIVKRLESTPELHRRFNDPHEHLRSIEFFAVTTDDGREGFAAILPATTTHAAEVALQLGGDDWGWVLPKRELPSSTEMIRAALSESSVR